MFWQLLPEDVIGRQATEGVPIITWEEWRARKAQFDTKTERTWPNLEPSERAQNVAEYVLRQFWQTFIKDRLVLRNATQTQTRTQPKSVFSCAMAVVDKIEGWEEEEKWVGSRFAACMWIYTEAVICNGQENTQEYLMQRFRSILEGVTWLCDDALEDHEWVSELTRSPLRRPQQDFIKYFQTTA